MVRVHRTAVAAARLFAVIGGLVLTCLILITCLSILGREINSLMHGDVMQWLAPGLAEALLGTGVGAISGDFELVEAGMAFAIFAFLPLCQVTAGHASVDILANLLPMGVRRVLIFLIEVLFAIVLIVIANQLASGMWRLERNGTTTFLLEFPVWWAYALSLSGAVLAAIAGVYMALVRLYELITGTPVVHMEGAEH